MGEPKATSRLFWARSWAWRRSATRATLWEVDLGEGGDETGPFIQGE